MIEALKAIVVPKLRERNFKGSFPHFRRVREDQIDLLAFQFDKRGGGFVIEISRCSSEGIVTAWGEQIPPNKVTVWDMPLSARLRLQPRFDGSTSGWFRYDTGSPLGNVFKKTAKAVLPFLEKAEKWWRGKTDSYLEEAEEWHIKATGTRSSAG